MDTLFFGLENDSNPMILATFDICNPQTAPGGKAGYEEILALYRSRIGQLPMLRRRLLRVPFNLDYPYWVEHEAFDLDQHFCRVRLPKPGTWSQLMRTVARLQNKPFDSTLPLWDVYVIEGINKVPDLPKGSFAVFMRMHHAFADGASTMAIREVLYDKSPELAGEVADSKQELDAGSQGLKIPGAARLMGSACLNAVRRTVGVSRDFVATAPVLMRHTINRTRESIEERSSPLAGMGPPKSLLNTKRMTTRRLVDARRFDFGEVRAIRALVKGATINDVVLAIVGGALRRYLAGRGDLPSQPLTSMVPINLRKEKATGGEGNVVSGMTLPIHQEIEDPVERLKAIHKASARAKEATAMEVNRRMMEMVGALPYPVLSIPVWAMVGWTDRVLAAPASTAVSNVPSFPEPRYLAGAEVVYLMGVGMLMPGVGTTHGFTIYSGQLIIGFICTPDVMMETDSYMACLEESFAEYEARAKTPGQESVR
jgi:WS/DGAT/MGAT family acyltransferase